MSRGAFPPTEPFTFLSTGLPFYNTEWLFDVVLYLGYAAAGLLGVMVIKAALSALLLLILWKDSDLSDNAGPDRITALLIRTSVLLGCLLLIRPRLVERPDLVLMIFLAFTIYALNSYLSRGSRLPYALPAMQVLWANVHPSVLVGMVPFVAILGGGVALRVAGRWRRQEIQGIPTPAQLRTVATVGGLVLAASLINPYGLEPLTLPFRLTASMWHTYNIVELWAPHPLRQPAPFVVTALLAIALLSTARRPPLITALLVGPFVVLALSARRFSYILAIVAAPVLARGAVALAEHLARRSVRRMIPAIAAAGLVAALASTALAVGNTGMFADSRRLPGLGVNDLFLPEGALRYLDGIGVGGRVYNTFHWGGYITWRDFPKRVPIIDGRGYVDPPLLWDFRFARQNTGVLERLRERYGFDVAILAYPPRERTEPDAFAPPHWALVYWDDVAVVYLRHSPGLAAHIERDAYRHVDPTRGPEALPPAGTASLPAVEAEIRRSLRQSPSSLGHMLLGYVKLRSREYDEAIAQFTRVRGYSAVVDAAQGLAMAHWHRGDPAAAAEQYRSVVEAYPTAVMRYNLALALIALGRDAEAVDHLERARRNDPQFVPVYPLLMQAYRRLGRVDRTGELVRDHATALALGQADSHLQRARQLSRDGQPTEAVAELEASLRLRPGHAATLSDLGDAYRQQGRLEEALDRQRAALALDPQLPQAHYGVARTYELRGDHAAARRHFEHYVRLDPASYLAWTVRRALSEAPPAATRGAAR